MVGRPSPRKSEDPEDFRATIAEHLEELRGRIIRSAIYLVVGAIIGWFLYPHVLNVMEPMLLKAVTSTHVHFQWVFLSFSDYFMLRFKMSCYIGLILAIPAVVYELWMFVKPGLRPTERKPFRTVVPLSLGLFLFGAGIGWITFVPTMTWFLGFASDTPNIGLIQNPYELMMFALKLMLAFGLSFQLPLVVYFLAFIGIISPDFLWRYWRHSTVGVFLVASLVTPSADPFSVLAMAIPLSVLFFGSVLAAKISFSRRKKLSGNGDLDQLD